MNAEPRTVNVNVLTTKSLEIDEPDWCAGHSSGRAEYKADVTHYGPEHVIEVNGFDLFRAVIGQSPFSQVASAPTLYVEEGDISGSYTPDQVEELADALVESAARLRALGRELARILAGGGQ